MKSIILFLKGMIIGVANIIPGVSGGTLMITLGIYEEIIDTISHFFKNFKKNLKFVIPIGLGMVVAVLLLSKIISLTLEKYPFPTTFFFVGLIIGGIPLLWKRASGAKSHYSNWIVFGVTFIFVLIFAFLKSSQFSVSFETFDLHMLIILFIVGMICAATMVIPGISGSFVLMMLGYYEPIVNTIKNLMDKELFLQSFLILIPFGIGIVAGIIGVAKLIEYLLKKYPVKTYYGVLGFVLASMFAIIRPLFSFSPSIVQVIISVVLVVLGGFIAYKLGDK